MPSKSDNEVFFRDLVTQQLKTRGRVHLRGLLRAMRGRLDAPATEAAQELALVLRGKLRLRGRRVRDVEAVRRILEGKEG